MSEFNDVFISYGRGESKAFCTKLYKQLTALGFGVWFDQNDIPLGVDFQNQIDDGIEKARNFCFVIAPHSVKSEFCLKEVVLAIKLRKRIIPILHIEPKDLWDKMHPVIAKLNWIYFREKYDPNVPQNQFEPIDDFDKAFQGLTSLLEHQKDFVYQHNFVLNKALYWERNQKRADYLLTGNERLQAEAWLKTKFEKEQPPCEPTDLHCEYVTEGIKNAMGMMTDVFLSYSTQDSEMMKRLKNGLMRSGFTVWTNLSDIKTGVEFQEEINKGIEAADTLVYLLSPDSLASQYCQIEIDYAKKLNKRIITLLIRETDLNTIPADIRAIQFIDFLVGKDEDGEKKFKDSADKILNELYKDNDYYDLHKVFLVKALKWQRQNNNPTVLLRGNGLKSAQAWFKAAKGRAQHPPLPIHSEFIAASEAIPADTTSEVFICYSRSDGDFCRMLNNALQEQGKTTWFDQESIDTGTDFQQEIYKGIESCENFLFVISPAAIESPYCVDEVAFAERSGKRFIPVLYRPVPTETIPKQLAAVQWIDFNKKQSEFHATFGELVRTLDTDREHVKSHTKWAQRAREWEHHDRSHDLLLRGREFTVTETWLLEADEQKKSPLPLPVQREWVKSSFEAIEAAKRAVERRRRITLISITTGMIIALILAAVAAWQRNEAVLQRAEAVKQKGIAEVNEKEAVKQKGIAEVNEKEALHQKGIAEVNEKEAILQKSIAVENEKIAIANEKEAVKQRNLALQGQVRILLSQVRRMRRVNDRLGALMAGVRAAQQMQQASEMPAELRDEVLSTLRQDLAEITERNRFEGGDRVLNLSFSDDGTKIAAVREDKSLEIRSIDGAVLSTWKASDHLVYKVKFSPNGQNVASISEDGKVRLWTPDGQLIKQLDAHDAWIWDIVYSPSGDRIATASHDQRVKLWSPTGDLLQTCETGDRITAIAFSPGGQRLAAAGWSGQITLFDPTGKKVGLIGDPSSSLTNLAFSPDGQLIAAAKTDNSIQVWDLQGQTKYVLKGHKSAISGLSISRNGELLISASADHTLNLWRMGDGKLLQAFSGHAHEITGLSLHPDGKTIISASKDQVKMWSLENVLADRRPLFASMDVSQLTDQSCDWLADFLENNSSVSADDRKLCHGHGALGEAK